jgi:tetratricopeptide (TPR) repeat protein
VVTSVSLTFEIARRFLSTGIQFIGVFTAVSTALLTLLGGTAFTQVGRRGLERALNRLRIRRRYLPATKIGLALFLLLLIVAINQLLPAFAVAFNNRAQDAQNTRQFASAINDYQLAINLNPDYPDPYYNLATTYEDVLDYGKAIDAYQRVQTVAPLGYYNLARSYNNLARLYITYRKDASGALKLLNTALDLNPAEPDIRYALLKNRGWSYLALITFGGRIWLLARRKATAHRVNQ